MSFLAFTFSFLLPASIADLNINATPQSDSVIRACDDDEAIRGQKEKPQWVNLNCSEEVNTWRLVTTQGEQTLPMNQKLNVSASSDQSAGEHVDRMVVNLEDRFHFICPKLEAVTERVKKTWMGDCDALVNALKETDGSVGKLCLNLIQAQRAVGDFESIPTGRIEEYCSRTIPDSELKNTKRGRGQ